MKKAGNCRRRTHAYSDLLQLLAALHGFPAEGTLTSASVVAHRAGALIWIRVEKKINNCEGQVCKPSASGSMGRQGLWKKETIQTLGITSTETIKAYEGRGRWGVGNFISKTYSLHRHHQNDSALRWAVV